MKQLISQDNLQARKAVKRVLGAVGVSFDRIRSNKGTEGNANVIGTHTLKFHGLGGAKRSKRVQKRVNRALKGLGLKVQYEDSHHKHQATTMAVVNR